MAKKMTKAQAKEELEILEWEIRGETAFLARIDRHRQGLKNRVFLIEASIQEFKGIRAAR